jgi:hypothetical protein
MPGCQLRSQQRGQHFFRMSMDGSRSRETFVRPIYLICRNILDVSGRFRIVDWCWMRESNPCLRSRPRGGKFRLAHIRYSPSRLRRPSTGQPVRAHEISALKLGLSRPCSERPIDSEGARPPRRTPQPEAARSCPCPLDVCARRSCVALRRTIASSISRRWRSR